MTSLDVRNNSAVMKRAEQLKRWEESDTNQQPATPKPKQGSRIKFSSGCVFLAACLAGEKDEVLNMLEQGADINTTNIDGLTALHQACIDDNLEMVEFLVEHGADINHQDNEGWTPLHATTSCGFVSIARYLVEHGADVAAVNSDGDLAVDLAVDIQHLPMIDFLQKIVNEQQVDCAKARQAEEQQMLNDAKKWLRSDASEVDRPHPKTGHTALHVAAAKGYTKVLSLLLAGRANVDAQDNDGWTALHAAAHWGQKEAAEMLVDAMADMDIRNYSGQTCIDVADRKMVKFLEDLRANNKCIKRRPSSQISRISDTIENHMVDKATTKIIRVEVRPDHNKDHINDENYLPAQKTSNDTTITQLITASASTDDEAPWRRNNTTRTGSGIVRTSFTESTIKNQVPDKGVNNTTSSSMPTTITATAATTTPTTNSNNSNSNDTSDVILRRTQSFENDEKKSPPITPPPPPKIPKTPTSMNTTPVRRSFVPPVRDEESETQRKAHAKRVRETRRSTQGVTLDEIKSAEELVKKKNSNINNNNNTSSNNNNSSEDGGNSNNNSNNSNNEIQLNTTTADITATTTTTTAVTNSISKEQEQKTDVTISTSTARITPPTTTTTTTGEKKTVSGALQKLTENIEIMASFTLSAPQGQAKLRTVTTALTATTPTTITATTTTTIPITTTSITLIPRNHHIKNNKTNNDIKIKVDNNKMKNEDVSVEREGEKEKITTFIMSPRKSLTPIENVAATFILSTPMKDKKKSRTDDLVSDDKVIKERNTNVQNVKEDNSNKEQQLTKPTVSTTTANESLKEGQLERSKATNERIRAAFFNTQNSATTTVTTATTTTATTTAATLPVTTVNLPVNYREKRSICDSDKNNSNSATYRIELSDIKQKYIDEADKNCHNTSNNNNTNNSKSNNSMDDSKNSPIASVSYNYTSRRSLDSVSSSLPSSPLHHNNNNSNSSNLSGRQKETGGFDITTTTSSSSYGSLSTNIHATTTIAGNINNNTTNTVSNLHAAERRPSWRLKFDSGSKFKLEDATSGNTYLPNNTSIIPSAPAVIAAANLSSIAQRRISAPNNNSSVSSLNANSSVANQISNISVRPVSAPPSSSDTSTTSIININHISSHNSDDNNSNLNSSYTPRPQRVSATTSTTALIPETKNVSINTNHSVSTPITNIANNSSNNTTIHNDNIDNDKENDNRSAQSVIQRRRKPKRRSTGVVHVDMDDIDPDRQDSANDGEEKESGSEQRHTPRSRLETTSSDAASSSSTVANDKKTRDKTDHDDNIDYKALWEAVKLENEKLKQQLKKKDDEITQTRTTLERFANTQLEIYKTENLRLKEENGALIRVISKLSK